MKENSKELNNNKEIVIKNNNNNNEKRIDAFGNIIVDKGKAHQIVFNNFRTQVIEVENWK